VSGRSVLTPVKRSCISQQIVVPLCQMTRSQRIRPGDRLPPERELVETFQASRDSLREIAGVINASRRRCLHARIV
jgi:GntR family transcriptional regulator, transcriptional repressor for pyruvate dehydrogenase complex